MEKAMATHPSTFAWKIPWTEEPGGLQSMGSHRVGHDWVTSLSLSCIGEGNGNLLQCSCLENPREGRSWWAAVYGVVQSRTWLKWLSSRIFFLLTVGDFKLSLWLAFVAHISREQHCLEGGTVSSPPTLRQIFPDLLSLLTMSFSFSFPFISIPLQSA